MTLSVLFPPSCIVTHSVEGTDLLLKCSVDANPEVRILLRKPLEDAHPEVLNSSRKPLLALNADCCRPPSPGHWRTNPWKEKMAIEQEINRQAS